MERVDIFRVVTYERRTEFSQPFFQVSLFVSLRKLSETQTQLNTLLPNECTISSVAQIERIFSTNNCNFFYFHYKKIMLNQNNM